VPYTFESLSPVDFEDLSRDLLERELGFSLESFKPGKDAGIDLRYSRATNGDLIVQCKHFRGSGLKALISHLRRSELEKIRRLNPSRYLLITSVPLSPSDKETIQALLAPYIQVAQDILGSNDINGLLSKFPEVERRHFKLWLASAEALDHFFNRPERSRSAALVDRVKAKAHLYAANDSFGRALDILKAHHVCVIAGVPGVGKTTLADVLLIHHLNQGYEAVEISRDIAEADALFNAEAKQFFYYDDFLGTAFDETLPKNEDSRLVTFIRRISEMGNKRLVLTTREYILKNAAARYERLGQVVRVERKCILSVADYTARVRAKILYNHVYFSKLPRPARVALVEENQYSSIIAHQSFNPRLVEHAIAYAIERQVAPAAFPRLVLDTFDNPTSLWDHAFRSQLPPVAQAILLSLAFLPTGVILEDLEVTSTRLAQHRSGTNVAPIEWRRNLRLVDGTFLHIESKVLYASPRQCVAFHTPAIRDYILRYVSEEAHEVTTLVNSATNFELLVNLWEAANTRDGEDFRLPELARTLEREVATLAQAISSNMGAKTCQPANEYGTRSSDYDKQATEDERLLQLVNLGARSKSKLLRELPTTFVQRAFPRWTGRVGDRAVVAQIVAKHEIPDELREALTVWATTDLDTIDAFELAAGLDLHDGSPHASEIRYAFEALVDGEENFILHHTSRADEAVAALDAVTSLSAKLGYSPRWDEDRIQERIAELEGPEPDDDFDYDEAREAHRERMADEREEREEIAELFSTLVTEDGEEAG
jgi:hypothetical protein